MIQRLDALKKAIIWDIIKTIGLVVFTIPLWLMMNINKSSAIADYYDNYNYIETEMLNNCLITSLKYWLKAEPC